MVEVKYPVPEMKPGEEIKVLKQRLEKLEAQFGREQEPAPAEKERVVKEEIKTYLQELQLNPGPAPLPGTQATAKEISQFEPSQQIGALVGLVFQQGLTKAIAVAQDIDNPAILDEFHDTLVDHYYQKLIEEKII